MQFDEHHRRDFYQCPARGEGTVPCCCGLIHSPVSMSKMKQSLKYSFPLVPKKQFRLNSCKCVTVEDLQKVQLWMFYE